MGAPVTAYGGRFDESKRFTPRSGLRTGEQPAPKILHLHSAVRHDSDTGRPYDENVVISAQRMGKPSIKDVAQLAKVSMSTVSRTLNVPDLVSAATASRVRKAIDRLGFRPNLVGRNLRAGRTRTIGVVLPTFANAVFSDCLQGLEASARELDYAVVPTATDYQVADEHAASERLLRHRVDGLVLTVANARASRLLDRLDRERVAYVLVYNPVPTGRRLTVCVDNRSAAADVVTHLIELGHRRIRMLAGSLVTSDRAGQRYLGYQDAMRKAGLAPHPLAEMPNHLGGNVDTLRDLLGARDAPTALFCSNDLLAIGVLRDLQMLGRSVPADVSLAGFDGIALGSLITPSLTTIVQPSAAMGAGALRLLVARLQGRRDLSSIVMPHRLRVGESTRAVSARPVRHQRRTR